MRIVSPCGHTGCMGGSWLDRGHGDGESLVQVAGVPARDMIRRSDRGSAGWNSRSTKAIVGALATAALIGSAGTAYAIRETLFPTLGAPTSRSVWSNPVPLDEPAEVTVASVTTSTSTSTVPAVTVAPASTASATVASVEDHAGTVEVQASGSGTSGRRGSVSNTVVPDIDDSGSNEHATTTEPVSTAGPTPTVPESGSGGVASTEAPGSGRGSSGSGSDGDSDNSGSGHSGSDDDGSDSDDRSGRDDDRSGSDDRSSRNDRSDSDD